MTVSRELPRFEWYQTEPQEEIKRWGNVTSRTLISAEYRWRLIARNGEIIASGEGYTTKRGVIRAIKAVKRNAAVAGAVQAS